MDNIRELIEDFTDKLGAAVQRQVQERARVVVEQAFGGGGRRASQASASTMLAFGKRPRRKAPRQLCPVPGCKNPAAPVFGMVCRAHKDVPKAKIKRYREERRAKNEKNGKGG